MSSPSLWPSSDSARGKNSWIKWTRGGH